MNSSAIDSMNPDHHRTPHGYAHGDYARSLSAIGRPRALSECGGWILERRIADSDRLDAMGCYPLFCCLDWSRLPSDLDALRDSIAVSLVVDPIGCRSLDAIRDAFDIARPFKTHYLVDLRRDFAREISAHHRRKATRGLRALAIELVTPATEGLDDWCRLYDVLIARHAIRGIAAWSRAAFHIQMSVPGIRLFRAVAGGQVVGATMWYVDDRCAYYHLGAYSAHGYETDASFALFWHALFSFAESGVAVANLGGAAGIADTANGLARFKRGWSTDTAPSHVLGKILDRRSYESLAAGLRDDYFPPYRRGEFSAS